uniref:Phosphoinositide phospholipase C n=1 Tax=Ditylenchus dipsaci TaxID=166011 RepID=A0A915D160_9BILA
MRPSSSGSKYNVSPTRGSHSNVPSAQARRGIFAMSNNSGSIVGSPTSSSPSNSLRRSHNRHVVVGEMDIEKILNAMEKGHKVCRILLLKKWDTSFKKLSFNRDTRQISLSKFVETNARSPSSVSALPPATPLKTLDLRLVKDIQTLDFKLNTIKITDKWKKDKELQTFNSDKILVVSYGSTFVLNNWILMFDASETCKLWWQALHYLRLELEDVSHYLTVERWLRKQFYSILNPDTSSITIRHMKPFVQTKLQCKVQSKQLQEITEGEMGFEAFVSAHNRLLNFNAIFDAKFSEFGDENHRVNFAGFLKFINNYQGDEMGQHKEQASDFLRKYLRDVDSSRDVPEPFLTSEEFVDYLFSPENSLFNPVCRKVVQDMNQPLTHYWIASSHNTYLTGDQLKSESSLEAYSRALMMGCRCIELDCWDGQKKGINEPLEIVVYHGYTMTTKLNLRDVLHTIKHYAFLTSDYPVILSIEDNCSVPAQRQMALDIKEIIGDLLLTQPVSRDEWHLPSPAALKKKIILKHKKLQLESDVIVSQSVEDDQEMDILSRECAKKGVLYLRDNTKHVWTKHVFVLFMDRLCYILDPVETNDLFSKDDTVSQMGDEDAGEEPGYSGFGVRAEEMHVTEEWFHGKLGRDAAKSRLLEHKEKGNGVFLVRESTTFIGDFTLTFLHAGSVHHCRIKTSMSGGDKKYYFLDTHKRDTLYELISYYTKNSLDTPSFKAYLLIPCPQPQPHLNQPWFLDKADKQRAEELLSTVREDGAFLIRYSSSDQNVFVLSLRVDGEFWHYRLKRDGRIFVVNQTVFENLNQVVDFYSSREFVRGIYLKFPVNEKNVGQYASNELNASGPGCYMELKDLDKEVEVVAIKSFAGMQNDHLSFPINAHIKVIRKEPDLWKGRFDGKVGWFPADHVQEIGNAIDSALNYETIELAGSLFEKFESDRPHSFRVTQSSTHWNVQEYIVAAESREEMDDWLSTMHSLTRTVNDKIHLLRTKEKQLRIASELSSLVVYCQAVPFNAEFALQDPRMSFFEMCSFSESKHDKLLEKGLVLFNSRQLSRVYPQASRLTSTNFNPIPMWNSGCHMVALNYQTGDKAMQFNEGKFSGNGRCGYVLKPAYLMDETFRPEQPLSLSNCPPSKTSLPILSATSVDGSSSTPVLSASGSNSPTGNNFPINLTLQVISGRHLSRKDHNKGICSPFVEDKYCYLKWPQPNVDDTFVFNIFRPEVALLRFSVEDGDFVGPKADPFIGQAVFPLDCIRNGFRSIPLLNQFSEPLELSALMVHVEIRALSSTTQSIVPRHRSPSSVLCSSPNMMIFESAAAFSGFTPSNSMSDMPIRDPHIHLQAGRLQSSGSSNGGEQNSSSDGQSKGAPRGV